MTTPPAACSCNPEAHDLGPEGQRRYFPDRYCPLHGESATATIGPGLCPDCLAPWDPDRDHACPRCSVTREDQAAAAGLFDPLNEEER